MSYQIFVQNQLHNGYQAMVIGLPDCVAEGTTEEEAVTKAQDALKAMAGARQTQHGRA